MSLGRRIKERREFLDLTQGTVAEALKIPRELISMWENESRTPSMGQLQEISLLLEVSQDFLLLGKEDKTQRLEPIPRGAIDESSRIKVNRWLKFLDDWAVFKEDLDEEILRPRLYRHFEAHRGIDDSRRAANLALEVREKLELGLDAIPDLYALLNEVGILVYRTALSPLQEQGSISGAFMNHPNVGESIFVNTNVSMGRQMFTLAHELAHALFHYSNRDYHLSLPSKQSKMERFANVFAANFLVPGKKLKELASDDVGPYEAIELAAYFRVSYWMLLVRLKEEKLITEANFEAFRSYSAEDMADRLGLNSDVFSSGKKEFHYLSRYPTKVISEVKEAIKNDLISHKDAANLLDVDVSAIQTILLGSFKPASEEEIEARDSEEYRFAS